MTTRRLGGEAERRGRGSESNTTKKSKWGLKAWIKEVVRGNLHGLSTTCLRDDIMKIILMKAFRRGEHVIFKYKTKLGYCKLEAIEIDEYNIYNNIPEAKIYYNERHFRAV